jgi:sterol desaturase/sphingolipid hydroxylase (fatty acid hydroxylase superfamily)
VRSFLVNNAWLALLTVASWPLIRQFGIHAGAVAAGLAGGRAQVLFFIYLDDFLYYGVHRLMHRGWLWKNVHSVHHRIHTPWAITGHYMHPIEYLTTASAHAGGPAAAGRARAAAVDLGGHPAVGGGRGARGLRLPVQPHAPAARVPRGGASRLPTTRR